MFKNYLKVLPKGVQISIFFGMWVALFFLGSLISGVVQTQFFGIDLEGASTITQTAPSAAMIMNVIIQIFMFGLPAILFAYLSDPDMKGYLGWSKNNKTQSLFALFTIAGLMIFFVSSLAGLIKTIDLGDIANQMQAAREEHISSYLKNSDWQGILLAIFLMAVIPAICEELFFRGVFMKIMINVSSRPVMAFIFTSLFFTFLHSSIYEFLPIFCASMILCFVYYYTGNIMNSIIIHFLNNAIQVVIVVFSNTEQQLATSLQDKLTLVGVLLITALGLVLLMRQIYKKHQPQPHFWALQQPTIDKSY